MPNLTDLVVPLEAYQQNAFDKRSEDIQSTRLKNRDALMKIYDEAASRGVSLSMEDMAQQAQQILGPTSWLYSTAPSVDVMNQMNASQNALANQTKEKIRREQFSTDIKESKDMEGFVSELAMTGKTADEIHANGFEQFGDRFTKIAPNVTRIMDKASFQAMNEGAATAKNFGLMTDDAEDFIEQNKSHLSESMINGIRKTAQSNQSMAEDKIMQAARGLADKGGWANTADDAQNIRNLITSAYPSMKPETTEKIYQKAMDAAKVSAGTKAQADGNARMMKASEFAAQQAGQMELNAISLEQRELEGRDARAAAYRNQAKDAVDNSKLQLALIDGVDPTSRKPTGKALITDPTERSQAAAIVQSYRVDNAEELVNVIKTGDQKRIRQYIAGLQPMAVYIDRVNQSASLTTAPMTSYAEFLGRASGMGATDSAIMGMGKQYKEDIDTLLKSNANSTALVEKVEQSDGIEASAYALSTPMFGSRPKAAVTSGTENEMAMATTKAAETRINGMMSVGSSQIKAFREMASINQSFSAAPEQMLEQERLMALKMAKSFLSGAGYTPDSKAYGESAEAMADQILRGAGDPMHITRRVTAADRINDYNKRVAAGQGVIPAAMVPPGSVVPNQRASLNGSAGLTANFQ
jgi:hypothetical protein